jgi:hypothetical protein
MIYDFLYAYKAYIKSSIAAGKILRAIEESAKKETSTKEFMEGYDAGNLHGISSIKCPYDKSQKEYVLWCKGYHSAQNVDKIKKY